MCFQEGQSVARHAPLLLLLRLPATACPCYEALAAAPSRLLCCSGPLPAKWASVMPNLERLNLAGNPIVGMLSTIFHRLVHHNLLTVQGPTSSNQITGQNECTSAPRAGGLPGLWGLTTNAWPDSIRINICATNVKGHIPKNWNSGSIEIYVDPAPKGVCGVWMPVPFRSPGYDAGVYKCSLWPDGNSGQKFLTLPACKKA